MFEELGITKVAYSTTQQNPEMRLVTVGPLADPTMVLNGLGFINQQLYSRAPLFHNIAAPSSHLPQASKPVIFNKSGTLGRALDTLSQDGAN